MSFFYKFSFFFPMFFVAVQSQAGFHFEPYIGAAIKGEWESGSSKDDVSMTELGFKMGYQAPSGFQVGGELQLAGSTYDRFLSTTDTKAGLAAFGLYMGYQSEMGLRGYAHFLFASALAFDDVDKTGLGGNGFKLGVGYSFVSWFAINLEYHLMKYTKYKDNDVSDFTSLTPEFKNNFVFLTFSFPFNFGSGTDSRDSYRRSR
ncbi:MAG: hypothetical protein K2Q26_08865 [Bdellovibrionales bacterium]|nr:hypothetical protein [Bdellovibrionales bacterium]